MEIKHSSKPNYPTPTMLNKVAKLLPILALVVAAPSFAAGNYSSHNHAHGQIAAGGMGQHMDDLNLTPEQKTKVEALRAATKTQMDAVFTPEQRQRMMQIADMCPVHKMLSGTADISTRERLSE